ncbi:MAG: hypothetical protein JJU12_02040 [Chlamydiales bacterium]|nr:hypothetical protein [Chlamydiales bacterium]
MNWMPFVLLALGLLMIFFEFFLPGGIIGTAGGLLVLLSIIFFGLQAKTALPVLLFTLFALFMVGVLIAFAIWRIKRGKMSGIFLNSEQSGYIASEFAKELIGEEGEALSDLKPSGHVLVNKKRYQAVSKMGYVNKGSKIKVVGGEGAHLIVKIKVDS